MNEANTKSLPTNRTAKKHTSETTSENNQGQERDCLAKDSKEQGQMKEPSLQNKQGIQSK
jgi:hypothetical protein